MDDERDISIFWWPVRFISEFRVHLIVAMVIGTVWCAGWARAVRSKWSNETLNLPPLVMADWTRGSHTTRQRAEDTDAKTETSPSQTDELAAPDVKRVARRVRPYSPLATLRDGVD